MGRNASLPRLERLDRLQGLLRAGDLATVDALAEATGASARTVRRDLELLRRRGLPIDGERGRGGGVRLDRQWQLGRLNLGIEEAMGLLLSMAIAERLGAPVLLGRLWATRQKLAAAFSAEQQAQIRGLRQRVLIGAPASERVRASVRAAAPAEWPALGQAFFARRRLRIAYEDGAGTITERSIEPQFLYLNLPVWYVLAWDQLRDAIRLFRLDRVRAATLLPETFRLRDPAPFLEQAEREVGRL
ncbi:MAG: WYL domain-containing protein [Geminicoccaceae bacterium]